jgi:hypothetical protein
MFWVLEYKKPRVKAENILRRDVGRSAVIKS